MGVEVIVMGQHVVKGEVTNFLIHEIVSEPLLQSLVIALLAVTVDNHFNPCFTRRSRHSRVELPVITEVSIQINAHLFM
jgi:hypothetical protein